MSDEIFIKDDDSEFDPEDFNIDENMDFFPKNYNLEKVFDEQIHPLLKTIVNICNEHNIPMLTSFQYANNPEKVMLCTSVVMPQKRTCEKIVQVAKILLES